MKNENCTTTPQTTNIINNNNSEIYQHIKSSGHRFHILVPNEINLILFIFVSIFVILSLDLSYELNI